MDPAEAMRRAARSRVAHMATIGTDGGPHIVPITFALDGKMLYFAVDAKPKRTTRLQRLRNITANPAVSILVDHYEDDWDQLWWVRLDGIATVMSDGTEAERALGLLEARYEQYRRARPAGPLVAVSIERMTGWSAS